MVHHYYFRLCRMYVIIAIKNIFVIHLHSLNTSPRDTPRYVFNTLFGTEWKIMLDPYIEVDIEDINVLFLHDLLDISF